VGGVITYDLSVRDAEYLELRNVMEPHQYVLIHIEALPGLVSILNKAERQISSRRD
jgi:hypothetical protein